MLVEKITVNVGENNPIYIELYDVNTPNDELKYGDCKYNENNEMEVWYGESESGMSGWQVVPWSVTDATTVILGNIADKKSSEGTRNYIYRVMNNDIDFDEAKYTALPHQPAVGVGYE